MGFKEDVVTDSDIAAVIKKMRANALSGKYEAKGNAGKSEGGRYADEAPVVALTGNEIEGNTFEAAKNYYRTKLQGLTIQRDKVGSVQITGKGWAKMKGGLPKDSLKIQIIPSIKDVIAKGVYHGRTPEPNREDSFIAFHYFTANVKVGDVVHKVGLNVGERSDGKLFYNINHNPDRLYKGRRRSVLPPGNKPEDRTPSNNDYTQNINPVNIFIYSPKESKARYRKAKPSYKDHIGPKSIPKEKSYLSWFEKFITNVFDSQYALAKLEKGLDIVGSMSG